MTKKILIVDDEPDIVDLISSRLKRLGYNISCAYNGTDALALVRQEPPHCIILDMMLPDIQGASICAQLKSDEKYHSIPVILLTARNRDYDKDIGRAVKADAYITKPFDQEHLIAKIKDLTD